jgi:hypothetical protein
VSVFAALRRDVMEPTRIPPPPGYIGLFIGGSLAFGVIGLIFFVFTQRVTGILLAVLCFGVAGVFVYGITFRRMGTYISADGIETRNALGTPRRVGWNEMKTIDTVWRGGLARQEFTRIVYGRNAEILFGPLQRDRSAAAFAEYLRQCASEHGSVPAT